MVEPVLITALVGASAVIGWVTYLVVRRRHRDELVEMEQGVRQLLDELPNALVLVDERGTVVSANARALDLLGSATTVDDATPTGVAIRDELEGRQLGDLLGPPGAKVLSEAQDHREIPINIPGGLITDRGRRDIELTWHPASETSRRRAVIELRDTTSRVASERALDEARHRFQRAFHSAPTGMALVRVEDNRIIDANESLAEMLQTEARLLVGCTLREFTHPDDVTIAQTHRARLELGIIESFEMEQRFARRDGDFVWARVRVSVTEDDGLPLAITHIENITEQRRAEEQLRYAAWHDQLTGLPNRSYLMQLLEDRLGERGVDEVALLFIDLDQFKLINDGLGHEFGDEVLRVIADRLRGALGSEDVLARFGGDEFVVITDARRALELADALRRSILPPIEIDEHELFFTASIGIGKNDEPTDEPTDLLRDADAAMYRAKGNGRNCVELFAKNDRDLGAKALRLAGELRHGIGRGEIVPYFQPLVDLASGRVQGYEVLARWLHPERGLLYPGDFLPLAEDTGLLGALGARVLRDALTQLSSWRKAGLTIGTSKLAVNVGTQQLLDPGFASMVEDALRSTGVDPDQLWIEITETTLLSDVDQAGDALEQLRELGLHLAVDDFGTGYSSLTYLRRFPVEAIKIDRSFVSGIGVEAEDTSIVGAVIRLGEALGLDVIAEGIESPMQVERLRSLGCEIGQGYLYGRPRPADLIERDPDLVAFLPGPEQ